MAHLVLCCGKVASGKSTFARALAVDFNFVHFSADDWMLHFYPPTPYRELFDANLERCVSMIYRVSGQLLGNGQNVVLDFGFWKKADRQSARARFEGAGHRVSLVYFPVDAATQTRFLSRRQSKGQAAGQTRHYQFDAQTVAALNALFEEPAGEQFYTAVDFLSGGLMV